MKTEIIRIIEHENPQAALDRAAQVVREGGLVAFPTETVYGLGGNGLDPAASAKIYEAKGRPSDNPLILHIASREELIPLTKEIPAMAEKLMDTFWPGPMTLIFEKSDRVPRETTGGLDTVAIRMPSHPVAQELIRKAGVPIAAPSANLSGHPSPTSASHVEEDLSGRIDLLIDGGDVAIGLESTIIDVTGEEPVVLRPGYISLEAIRRLMGRGEFDPGIVGAPSENVRPKAPGMRYRHYAPKAEMSIVDGDPEAVVQTILRLAGEKEAAGARVGILCAEESAADYGAHSCKKIGAAAREETIAHNLYRCLREFDVEEVDYIYSESFSGGELGDAIMNRLMKAAGYRVISAGGNHGEI